MEPIVVEVDGPVTAEEVVLIAHHLASQGFHVEIESYEPFAVRLTVPNEKPSGES